MGKEERKLSSHHESPSIVSLGVFHPGIHPAFYFMFSLINVLDLVSILSIITDLAVGSNPMEINTISEYLLYLFVKIFWVCRCFRLIWFLRMSSFGLVSMYTVRKGRVDFLAVFVSFCFTALLFSIYFSASEQHSNGQHINMLDALWWAFITLTTVEMYIPTQDSLRFSALFRVYYFMRALSLCFSQNSLNTKLLVDTQKQNILPENVVKLPNTLRLPPFA